MLLWLLLSDQSLFEKISDQRPKYLHKLKCLCVRRYVGDHLVTRATWTSTCASMRKETRRTDVTFVAKC